MQVLQLAHATAPGSLQLKTNHGSIFISSPTTSSLGSGPASDQAYCYWDIRSDPDFVIVCVNLGLALLIVSQVAVAFRRSRIYLEPGSHSIIYYLLFSWFLAYIVQYTFSAAVYQTVFKHQLEWQQIVKYSKIFQFLDFFAAFLLMGSLFFVSFLLTRVHRIHSLCQKKGHRPSKPELYFYIFLKNYMRVRILEIIPTAVLLFLNDTDSLRVCSKLELAFFLLDSLLCNISLLVAVTTIRRKNEQLNIENLQQKKKLFRESVLLQVAGICRLLLGIMFIFVGSVDVECPEASELRTYLYLLMGQLVMHFVPVAVVLSIFRVSSSEIRISEQFGKNMQTRLNPPSEDTI